MTARDAQAGIKVLEGFEAIGYAIGSDIETVRKYADPVEGAREVSLDEALAIAQEDPSLIWIEASE